jgi:hypothetical protein
MSLKLPQTFSHSSSHHRLIIDATINNQYTKNVEPKHEAKRASKAWKPQNTTATNHKHLT